MLESINILMIFGLSLAKRIYFNPYFPYPRYTIFVSRDSLDSAKESPPRFPLLLYFKHHGGGIGLGPL